MPAQANTDRPENLLDNSKLKDYRTELPNIIDDFGLSPYEFRLYVHYTRAANSDRKCSQGMRYIAKTCNMSLGQAHKARTKLIDYGLLWIQPSESEADLVIIPDIWEANFRIYLAPKGDERQSVVEALKRSLYEHPQRRSSYEHLRSRSEHQRSYHERKKEHIKKEPVKNLKAGANRAEALSPAVDPLAKDLDSVDPKMLEIALAAKGTGRLSEPTEAEVTTFLEEAGIKPATPEENPERKVPPKESTPPAQAGILAAAEQSTQAMASAMKAMPYAPAFTLPVFKGLSWYMCAGDNYLIHLAKPTKTGKQIKPVCGCDCPYGTEITGMPIGQRQPCQGCLRKMAPPTITPEVKNAFALLCKKDWEMDADAKAMMGALKKLKDPTVDRLRTFYCNWYKQDWRGKRGDAPKPNQVVEQWTPYTTEDCKQAEDIFGKGVNNGTDSQTAAATGGQTTGNLGQPQRTDQPGRDIAAEGRADAAALEEFKRAWTKRPLRL